MDVVAGLAYRTRDKTVLLGKRKAHGRRGALWEMPGGKVDAGETHEQALTREWKEELGLAIDVNPICIAKASFQLEVSFTVHLYHVRYDLFYTPQKLDHDELLYSNLDHAIEYMPCSPALYVHYPAVREFLANFRE